MKWTVVIALLLTFTLLSGCKHSSADAVPPGAFAYASYDSGGAAIARGWFTAVAADSTKLAGEWHFEPVGDPQRIGPQLGDGKLVGGIDGQKVWIELNPEVRNNNLQLNGTLVKGQLNGQWTWINYEGIANQGTFQATKR